MTPRELTAFVGETEDDGLTRSARLLRAIGPNAAPIWAQLSTAESAALREKIEALPPDDLAKAQSAQALLNRADRYGTSPVWQKLSDLPTAQLFALVQGEHPQMIALCLTQLTPKAAANLIALMPTQLAEPVLHLVLRTGQPHPAAIAGIEALLDSEVGLDQNAPPVQGDTVLARIFDVLETEKSQRLLDTLSAKDAEASARVRKLMFTFEDMASLPPAALQTLLSRTDRPTLTLALKGASTDIAEAIFGNMTQRARTVLTEEMAAIGPVRRSDVEAARTDMIVLARHLIETGDILPTGSERDLIDEALAE